MANHKLNEGDTAPDFNAVDVLGKHIRLSDYKKHPLLLVFLRYAGCPWCNLAIHRLAMEYRMLKAEKCEVIAFIQSTDEQVQKNIYERHEVKPTFSIIADHEKEFYTLYGIKSSKKAAIKSIKSIPHWVHAVKDHGFKQTEIDGDLFLVPAAFLISSRTQKIVKADYGTSFYEFESFLNFYESLTFHEA